MVEDVSELYDSVNEEMRPLHITSISCGKRHCLATLDYGGFYYWGENAAGQLGNKKRCFRESPFPMKKFEFHHNVISLACGYDSSAVIVETLPDRKKSSKKKKREMTLAELNRITEAQIEAENQAKVAKAKEEEQKRVPMDMRFRSKLSSMFYSGSSDDTEEQKAAPDQQT
mmetsp:Transcript_39668/g.51983  ORF Transcript_39668/g.51983 Transcript_39668/m.51983 type:complete len:171 (+) Transcript_39668:629-1141(+)